MRYVVFFRNVDSGRKSESSTLKIYATSQKIRHEPKKNCKFSSSDSDASSPCLWKTGGGEEQGQFIEQY